MHYILLSIALNLGKENIGYMKLDDMKKLTKVEKVSIKKTNQEIKQKEKELTVLTSNTEILPMIDQSFLNDSENFTLPYVGSNDFAELLPEDELGNIQQTTEEQGPKFLDDIKNKLIKATEKKKPEVLIGSQIEGPSFLNTIKNTLEEKVISTEKNKNNQKKEVIIASEDVGPNFFTTIKNKIIGNNEENTKKPVKKEEVIIGSQIEGPNIINKIKDKALETGDKIKNIDVKKTIAEVKSSNFIGNITDKLTKKEVVDIEDREIKGTLFDSELNQAIKDEKILQYKEILNKENYKDIDEINYEEEEKYIKFLKEKEIDSLIKPEKILVPNIRPSKKEYITYKTQEVAEELLEARSFQNRHIPAIIQGDDKEKVLEKVIEYGMITEFRAYMNDFRDANFTMKNQYTLLTYATKNKQYPIMKYLIHVGADINKRDKKLDTPLIMALQNSDMKAIEILINANANPNIVDLLKRTPLIYTIEKNQEKIGVYLIENGADVNITNGVGEGTLAMSIRLGRNIIKEKIINTLQTKKKL